MRVLIVKLSSIGDVTQTLPSLYLLRRGLARRAKEVEIDWLVEEPSESLLKGNPLINNLIVVKNRGWVRDLSSNLRTASFLRSRDYDMVIDFQGLMKSALWVALSGGKRRIGFSNGRELSHLALNEKLPPYDPDRHAVERYLDLAEFALSEGRAERKKKGDVGDASRAVFHLNITDGEIKKVKDILARKGLKHGAPFFSIVSRARWRTKLWSDSSFVEFARKAVEGRTLYAVITGKAEDREQLERMREGIGDKSINLAGELDLKGLSALFHLSAFVLSVDSGPMHIAAAAGARVLALFGPTAPWRTGPYGKSHVILRKALDCSPCFRKTCSDIRCMREITVEEAVKAAEGLLPDKTLI